MFLLPNLKIIVLVTSLLGITATAALAMHKYIVKNKNAEIATLTTQVEELTGQNAVLRQAVIQNAETIRNLEVDAVEQNKRVSGLQSKNSAIASERDKYMSIFRRHDLTQLSIAKPGLIESRINAGTTDAFKQVEADTMPPAEPPK